MNAGETAIEAALRMLHMPGDVFEIRIPKAPGAGTISGYFDDPVKAVAAIARYDGKVSGVYVTMNPVNPDLLARASNHLKKRVTETTSDKDVVRRRWLLIDVDYHRPSGISATDAELRQAGTMARRIRAHLEQGLHWPAGALVHSGNGAHLLYLIDLPNDEGARALVKNVLLALADQFNEGDVHVDTSVHNASRIVKVPGTMACKGENLPERPHRRSGVLEQPDTFASIPVALLEDLARSIAPKAATVSQPGNGVSIPFNVPAFLERHHLPVRKSKDEGDGTLYELETCPFNHEHNQGEAFVWQHLSGAVSAGCHHDSCSWDWADLRENYEPGYRERRVQVSETSPIAPRQPLVVGVPPALQQCDDSSIECADDPFLDWSIAWDGERNTAEWVYENVLACGRGHAIYAAHKEGKSLFMLCLAARLATEHDKVVVMYLDYEMGLDDVVERLGDMGYGPTSDLSRLKYALLPVLAPLDQPDGATALMAMVDNLLAAWPEHHLVVVIDTMSRAVKGDENSADTFRDFYAQTGRQLKRRGVTWVRLDHAGKDLRKSQRGSSAKGDDVDVVWRLEGTQNGVCLHRDAARMHWVPDQVTFVLRQDPLLYHQVTEDWPAKTVETAAELDRLGVPLDTSKRKAQEVLRAAGAGRRAEVVAAALKYRRLAAEAPPTEGDNWVPDCGNQLPDVGPEPVPGPSAGLGSTRPGNHIGNHPEPLPESLREPGSPPKGEPVPGPSLLEADLAPREDPPSPEPLLERPVHYEHVNADASAPRMGETKTPALASTEKILI